MDSRLTWATHMKTVAGKASIKLSALEAITGLI